MELRSHAYLAGIRLPVRSAKSRKAGLLASVCAPALFGVISLAASDPAVAACMGPGTHTSTGGTPQTKCVTAVQITPPSAKPLRSFDISFVSKERDEYYLGDRSNKGVDVINTNSLAFVRTITGGTGACSSCTFVGVVVNKKGAVDNNHSGPDGVASHGRWLYAGDGDSTLKVIDLNIAGPNAIVQSVSTGGTTRVDEMALTTDGKLLVAANNAEDPPFATLFNANGDNATSTVSIIAKLTVNPTIIPPGFGLSLEQPAWDPNTQRFYTSIPVIANNLSGCNYGQVAGPITCDGGLLVTDPKNPQPVYGAYTATTNTGVIALHSCGPNGATLGPHNNIMLGCTPGNNPSDTITQVINVKTLNFVNVGNVTGSDEVWHNSGDNRYYLGASKDCTTPGSPCPAATQQTAVLGVVNGTTNFLIEKVPQSSGSHSVAADSEHNRIFVPQVAPVSVVGTGGDTTTVGQQLCGSTNGCVVVYEHKVDHDHDEDHNDQRAER